MKKKLKIKTLAKLWNELSFHNFTINDIHFCLELMLLLSE